ncbi:MAG: hypothetical protein AVW06_00590 [Hadesarchaea archaeon DG-33-1]|nr:MAG: hypothetical protein AVW06_00590 [Hadesarchaea archaeon DG-33-1]
METRKKAIFVALFYPFTIATVAAGFLAFVMLMLKLPMPAISTVVLGFYFVCAASIYLISKQMIESFGMRGLFLGFVLIIGVLAALSTVLFIWEQLGGANP